MSAGLCGRPSWRTARRGTAGFALLETLVAFAIVAIALGTLLSGISVGLRADRLADARRLALRSAQARLERLGVTEPLAEGWSEGLTDDGQGWRQDVTPVGLTVDGAAAGSSPPRLAAYWVEVSVTVEGGGDLSLRAVKLEPVQPRRPPA